MKFTYTAFDKAGKQVQSFVEAIDQKEAEEILRGKNLYVTELEQEAKEASEKISGDDRKKKVRASHRLRGVANFARQLHVLVTSGTPMVQALVAIERQSEDPAMKRVVADLRRRVEEGVPLSEAMKIQPAYFDSVARTLVAAGETSGTMPVMLDRLAVLTRKQLTLRNSVAGALVYPVLLVFVGICVLVGMLMFVLPRFADLFKSLTTPLPPTTKLLMFASHILLAYWWAVILGIAAIGVPLWLWTSSEKGKLYLQGLVLDVPKLGKLVRSITTARLARLMGVLLEGKVPLMETLALTRQAAVHVKYVELFAKAEDLVSRGEPVSAAFTGSRLISPAVQEAIRNGEQSGEMGAPLVHMADFLDEENEVILKSITGLLEPLILVFLGVIVGGIALSMFLPLFDLASAANGGG
jgi:type IV pilus assembly protein PilC